MPKFDPGETETDDLSCLVCGAPLLNKKSTCPKCGAKGGQQPVPIEAEPADRLPGAHFMQSTRAASVQNDKKEPALTMLMVFMSGIALLYALMNPIIDTFSMESLWRSLTILMLALILLGLRSILLRNPG